MEWPELNAKKNCKEAVYLLFLNIISSFGRVAKPSPLCGTYVMALPGFYMHHYLQPPHPLLLKSTRIYFKVTTQNTCS